MTERVRRALVAAVAASAIALSGCTASGWVPGAPPAAGTQAELPSLDKARNVMFIVDDSGKALLVGALSSVDGTEVKGVRYAPEGEGDTQTPEQPIDFTARIPRHGSVKLEDGKLVVKDPDLVAGRTARITIDFASGPLSFVVPIYSNRHADYRQIWSDNVT